MKKFLKPTFWVLVGTFFVVVSEIFIPVIGELLRGPLLFLLPIAVFSLLGIVLIFLVLKAKIAGPIKKFLLLTGISSAGFFIGVFLHNAFYALGIITSHIIVLSHLMEILHVAFFIIATIVCPLGFLVGIVGSIVLFIKNKNRFSGQALF